jgi:integrase/recombinase XerD
LLKACEGKSLRDRRDEAVVRFMLETGARAGEVAAMIVDDVDIKRGGVPAAV